MIFLDALLRGLGYGLGVAFGFGLGVCSLAGAVIWAFLTLKRTWRL